MSENWAILRQLVLASEDALADGATVREQLGLAEGFADPELHTIGLADYTMAVGPQKYLEVVSPMAAENPVSKWLAKVGGAGAYCLSVQIPDVPAAKERAAAAGVRLPIDVDVMGHPIIQLHPADVGILLELDGIADPAVWFWDDITPGPSDQAQIDDITGVTIGCPDPVKTCALWAQIIGLQPVDDITLDFSGTEIRFVHHERGQILAASFAVRTGQDAPADGPLLGLDASFE